MSARPRRLRSRTARLVTAGLVASLAWGLTGPITPANAEPTSSADAAAQAAALATRVEDLRTEAALATEHFNATNTKLAGVVTQMITASERRDALHRISADDRAEATRRISAIYKSGGGLSLYATVLDGGSPGDMVSRIRTVESLVGDDYEQTLDLDRQVREAGEAEDSLRALAAERVELERAAKAERARVMELVATTESALRDANATVRRLAEEEAERRQAAAEAEAQAALGTVTIDLDAPPGNPYAAKAIEFAASKIGLPYQWGGNGPNSYDCSGLMQQAYRAAGLSIMRVASDQYRAGPEIPLEKIAPGDLVFWSKNPANKRGIHHVAMYVGNGQMIEAPYTGAFIRLVPLRLSSEFAGAVRPGLGGGA